VSKVAFITDTHYGVRNDNHHFYNYFSNFFNDHFFPTIETQRVDKIVHLGDVVDRRKYINFLTSKHLREDFIDPISDMGIPMDIIVGNHDTYYKNTNDVNALNELLRSYSNINSYTDAVDVDMCGVPTLYLPWICTDNLHASIATLNNSKSRVCLGHLEIDGFTMHPGHVMHGGLTKSLFDKFELTCSGHFHHRSSRGDIHYLGCPYEMSWSDYGNQKGFHIYDTETHELQFYPNPDKMFHRIVFDLDEEPEIHARDIEGKYVKFVVKVNVKQSIVDSFVSEIEKHNPLDLTVVDESMITNQDDYEVTAEEIEDTFTIVSKYIDNLDTVVDKDQVKKKINELYQQAMTLE
jgi:DNA repair exonuclease SbcCD nuclease subunit